MQFLSTIAHIVSATGDCFEPPWSVLSKKNLAGEGFARSRCCLGCVMQDDVSFGT